MWSFQRGSNNTITALYSYYYYYYYLINNKQHSTLKSLENLKES